METTDLSTIKGIKEYQSRSIIALYHCINCAKIFTSNEINSKSPELCPKCKKKSIFDEPFTKLQQEYLDYAGCLTIRKI